MAKKKTHEQYELELFHMDKEFFPIEEYQGSNTSIVHECFEGHKWKAFPTNLLKESAGCPTCKGLIKKTTETYKNELKEASIDIIPIEEIINMSTPIKHKCVNGHIWKAKPGHILNTKTNCPSCNNTWGFKPAEPAILYYVKLTNKNKTYYKIGVSNKSVTERLKNEDVSIEIIRILNFKEGRKAKEVEKRILDKYPRVTDKNFLKSGYSELFEYDIGYK